MHDLVGHDTLKWERRRCGFVKEMIISLNEIRNTRNKFEETERI